MVVNLISGAHALPQVRSNEQNRTKTAMNNHFNDYFCCPDQFVKVESEGTLSGEMGYFRFTPDTICYGQYSGGTPAKNVSKSLPDASLAARYSENRLRLPFDLTQVVDNLRLERYCGDSMMPAHEIEKTGISRKL